jgi:hypothetical protein
MDRGYNLGPYIDIWSVFIDKNAGIWYNTLNYKKIQTYIMLE